MRNLAALLLFMLPLWVHASGSVELDDVEIDLADKASLMRGAEIYTHHCLSCHSLKHMRYATIAEAFGASEEEVTKNLILGDMKLVDAMTSAVPPDNAEEWFGTRTPDLSVVARSRGADWLYSYLRGFYLDPSRPYGVNNTVFPDVAMPNVLWELQGAQKLVKGVDGEMHLKLVKPGEMTPREFDRAMTDLVNFLVYAGEPHQLERVALGKYVILFLLVFVILAYRLKKEYWKEIH